jgi:hypothetical protein
MNSDRGCLNTVIFNDGEVVSRRNRDSTLGCFALPECASRTLTADYPADEQLMSFDDDKKKKKKDADIQEEGDEATIDLSAEYTGAFGLMERDEAAGSPSRKVVAPSINSSPRSVMSAKVHDSTPTQQQQQQQSEMFRAEKSSSDDNAPPPMGLTHFNSNATRDPISLEGYSIGDEAKLNDFSLDISKEDAALEAKSLEVGDAAFILRSDCKWTYSILIDKAVVPHGQSALRFEVGADNSRKTFMEAQWGKYIRVIKTTEQSTVVGETPTTAVAKKGDDAYAPSEDPDLSYYESDSDEDILNYYANEDAIDVTNSARPKGILRNKGVNSLDRYLRAKVVERKRSQGNSGYSVHFDTTDDAESWTSDPFTIEQAFGTKEDDEEDCIGEEEEEEEEEDDDDDESKLQPTENKVAEFEVEVEGEEESKPEPTENTAGEVEINEVRVELAHINDETPAVAQDKNVSNEAENTDQNAPIVDEKEGSLLQTPTQLYKKGLDLFNSELSPIRLDLATISPALECPTTPSKIGESWDVGQLLFKLAQPVFPWQLAVTPIGQEPNDAVVAEEDVADESLTIECELQNTADVKVHAVHVTPLHPAAIQSENEESKADATVHDIRIPSLPPTVFQGENDDALQSANELSILKRDALDIHNRRGSVKKSFGAMSSTPVLSKRERSIKNKLVAYTVSKVRSSKKSGKVKLDTLNITADTIDSYEVHPNF